MRLSAMRGSSNLVSGIVSEGSLLILLHMQGDDIIVNVVNVQPGKYSLSPDALIALKNANVSPRVMTAMMNKSQGGTLAEPPAPPPLAADPQSPQVPPVNEIGVYY